MSKPTQCDEVLRFMRRRGSISDVEAFMELGIRRLAARIYDLRQAGYNIESHDEEHDGGTHARYSLREETSGQFSMFVA